LGLLKRRKTKKIILLYPYYNGVSGAFNRYLLLEKLIKKNNIKVKLIKLYERKNSSGLLKIFYKIDIKDCTSGCQIFSKRLIQKFVEDENFEYSEIGAICKTKKIGYKIVEEFINMKPRVTGSSSFNFMNSFKYMYKNLLSIITSSSFKLK